MENSTRLSLERTPLTMIDRRLPAHPVPFLAAVAVIGVVAWLTGLLLAHDKARFLASRDWQFQPVYLAAHFVILRLFVTAYVKNFLAGCRSLTIEADDAWRRVRALLAPWGWAVAAVLAAPLIWYDLAYLLGPEYVARGENLGPGGALGPGDVLTGAIWAIEWVINAYVWLVIVGFLALTMRVLKTTTFRDDVDIVLGERRYRPFLLMSAQGASIVLGFTIVNGLYVWYAHGEATDYVGLWVTASLLVACFVPPWLKLKSGIARFARFEADRLNREIQQGVRSLDAPGASAAPESPAGLSARLNLLINMARAGHLERLYRDLGRNEGQMMLVRLLAPFSTAVWKFFRPG